MITTRTPKSRSVATGVAVIAALAMTAACGSSKPSAGANGGRQLVGLFQLTPGAAHGTQITGTWFRMIQPKTPGKPETFMVNANSTADGGRVTLLRPGSSGGLRTAGYQSQPKPAFARNGNSLANAVTAPANFFGVLFSTSTNEVDPQTKTKVPPPTVVDNNGKLTANLSAWAASWNNQNFNQGAPKPVTGTGAKALGQAKAEKAFDYVAHKYLAGAPQATVNGAGATGTYNATTGAFVLQWTSLIVGGPFNAFTGEWHLAGVFKPGSSGPTGP